MLGIGLECTVPPMKPAPKGIAAGREEQNGPPLEHAFRAFGIHVGGAWCPAYVDPECTKRVLERRPVLLLSTRGDALWGGLHWWNGALEPDAEHSHSEVNPLRRRSDRS